MSALVLPQEYKRLGVERDSVKAHLRKIDEARRDLRRAAMDAAGWKQCCRCYPRMVSDDGFCGCCLFNHVTGVPIDRPGSFRDEPDTAAPAEEKK